MTSELAQAQSTGEDLFYHELIRSYVQNPRFIARPWLANQIDEALTDPACRFLLLTAASGAGKTAFMAWLAHQHPTWPRYFIRRNQLEPLGDVGAHSLLLQIGFQLAAAHPALFSREELRVEIEQRIATVGPSGEAVATEIEKIFATPFYRTVLRIRQQVEHNHGRVTGLHVGEWVTDPRVLYLSNLQYMALFDPARVLLKQKPGVLLVILVDALDELRYRHAEESSVLGWLASCPVLPPNVRFVLASRPDEALLSTLRAAQQPWLKEITLAAAEQDLLKDLQAYALALTEEPAVQAAMEKVGNKREDFVKLAVQKASGNIGYLDAVGRAIDQALSRQDREALSQLLDLTQLPDTFEGLYAFFLHKTREKVERLSFRVEDSEGEVHYLNVWREVYLPILEVLVAAREPLTAEQIQRVGSIQASWNEYFDALNALRQFLDRIGNYYVLYHTTLAEFLTSSKTQQAPETAAFSLDEQKCHRRIARSYRKRAAEAGWDHVDDYGLRYYALHLSLAQEWQHLFALLDEGVFGRAKIEHDFNTLAYARDLELGQQAALRRELSREQRINLLPRLWHYCLLRSSLGTQADNYPDLAFLVMVMLGQYRRALAATELISDARRKARLMIEMGVQLVTLGQEEQAREVLGLVQEVVAAQIEFDTGIVHIILQQIVDHGRFALEVPLLDDLATTAQLIADDGQRALALAAIAVALAEAGAREQAEALALTIPYTGQEGQMLREIVDMLAKAQLWQSATIIAQSITDKAASRWAMSVVIVGLLGMQEWERARELVIRINPSERFDAMAEICLTRVLVEPEMVDELLKELASTPLPSDREHARSLTAQILGRAQQWDKAIATVQSIHNDFSQNYAASRILEQMLQAREWDMAVELASAVQESYHQLGFLDSLVKALMDAEQVEYASEEIARLIQTICEREQRAQKPDDRLLRHAVELLIQLRLWDNVEKVVGQIKDPKQLCQALAAIADALSNVQPQQAHQLISRAESIAYSLKKPGEEAYAYDPDPPGGILSTVAGNLSRMHFWDRAIALADAIPESWSDSARDEAFVAIVYALIWAGEWERALSIAQRIQSVEEQSKVLIAAVKALLVAQEWQRALEATQAIRDPKQRFAALTSFMQGLVYKQWKDGDESLAAEKAMPPIHPDTPPSEEDEKRWDDVIATAQKLFEVYRTPDAIVELLQGLAMVEQWERCLKIADTPALREHRAEILVVIVRFMLGAEEWEGALALARSIDVSAQKAEALATLAAAHIGGQTEQAVALLNEALAAAQAITDDEGEKSEAFAKLALQLNKMGRWEQALTITRSIYKHYDRVQTLVKIATARIDADSDQAVAMLGEALAFIRSQEEDHWTLLRYVAEALPLLPAIKGTHVLYAEFLSSIATLLRSNGDLERAAHLDALATAITSTGQEEQSGPLEEFRSLLEELTTVPDDYLGPLGFRLMRHNLEGLVKVNIGNPYAVSDAGEELYEGTEEAGGLGWAGRAPKQEKEDGRLRSEVWSIMRDGQPEKAADLLLGHIASKRYFNESQWGPLQRDLASSLARKQQWGQALAIAWSIREGWQKTQALARIAIALVQAGRRDWAQLLMLEAEATAHSVEDDRERNRALADVAETLVELQEPDEAGVVVEFIHDAPNTFPKKGNRPRFWITRALAQAQRWDEAKEVALHIGGPLQVSAMNSITDAMISCGEHEQALQYIQRVWMRAETRRELIKMLPFAREFIPLYPELGEALYNSFAWVDRFLQA